VLRDNAEGNPAIGRQTERMGLSGALEFTSKPSTHDALARKLCAHPLDFKMRPLASFDKLAKIPIYAKIFRNSDYVFM
jgi:hypothetical protein